MIRTWSIIISGYTQTEGVLHGCQELRFLLHDALASRENMVLQPPWNHDFDALASSIINDPAMGVRVNVYAYSWGCGNGLIKLAKALAKRQTQWRRVEINHAVLCDPVYHSQRFEAWPIIGHLARGIGVLRKGTIEIPANVHEVTWFRQKRNIPMGCDLVAEDTASTIIHPPILLAREHNQMDDAPDWHMKCLQVAEATT